MTRAATGCRQSGAVRHHVAYGDRNARHADTAVKAERGGRCLMTDQQVVDDPWRALHPMRVVGATGQMASTPASGSRMMPLAKLDAALFGLPGRTVMVGKRNERAIDHAAPRHVTDQQLAHRFLCAVGALRRQALVVGQYGGRSPPNTAMELVNTNLGGAGRARVSSSSARVASTLTRMPMSKSASA